MEEENKEHQRHFLELEKTVEARIRYLDDGAIAGFSKEETFARKEECVKLLHKVMKFRSRALNPIQTIETARGTQFKVGDKFHIAGDEISKYIIVAFPDSVTIRGESKNPAIGKPWTCEVYVESAFKAKKEKKLDTSDMDKLTSNTKKKVEDLLFNNIPAKRDNPAPKKKEVIIEKGDYFALRSNNTVYKAIKVKKGKVTGTNELTSKNASKLVKTKLTEIVIKTKKDYKKQIKAEKNYGK